MVSREDQDLRSARAYDGVAEVYERVNVPRMFAEPARVLVGEVAPPPSSRILDVGSGTGVVARTARDAAGKDAFVVVADASASMLRTARNAGLDDSVVAMLPVLPFAEGSFDIVTSAFVMTHLDDPDAAAREMARVLRPGGRIGLSAWYPGDDDATSEWSRVVHAFVDRARLEAATRQTLPADERFAVPGSLAELLEVAGFSAVMTKDHTTVCAMTVEEFVDAREVCATGRTLHVLLSAGDAIRLRERVLSVLHERFPDGIRFSRGFHTATGTR